MSAPTSRPPKSWTAKLVYLGLGLVTTAILATIIVLMFGGVRGTEIDPVTFASRDFTFYRVPFTRFQISPTWYNSTSNDFNQAINTFLDRKQSRKANWQVANVLHGTVYDFGDPKILDDLFSITSGDVNESYWVKWSNEHPEIAKLFWPIVSEIGVNDAYLILPEFVMSVRLVSSVDEFNTNAIPKLVSLYVQLAADHAEAGFPELVVTLTDLALSHDLDNAKAQKLQSDARRQLGNDQHADENSTIVSSEPGSSS